MIFSSSRRDPLDYKELVRLLPDPGDPVLPDDRRRQLEDFLMSNVTEDTPSVRTRRLALRLAAPVVVAAALTGTVFAFQQSTPDTATDHAAADSPRSGSPLWATP